MVLSRKNPTFQKKKSTGQLFQMETKPPAKLKHWVLPQVLTAQLRVSSMLLVSWLTSSARSIQSSAAKHGKSRVQAQPPLPGSVRSRAGVWLSHRMTFWSKFLFLKKSSRTSMGRMDSTLSTKLWRQPRSRFTADSSQSLLMLSRSMFERELSSESNSWTRRSKMKRKLRRKPETLPRKGTSHLEKNIRALTADFSISGNNFSKKSYCFH